jgi:hypothetical protein
MFSIFSMANAEDIKLKPSSTFEGGSRYKFNNIDVLNLCGDYREMGRQYGMLMKDKLKEFYHLALEKHLLKHEVLNYQEIRDISADLFDTYPQRFKEIIYGMAETSGMDVNKLIILDQILPVSYVSSTYNNMGCSAIATWGDYTSGGPLVLGRNFDYLAYFKQFGEYLIITVYNPTDGSIPTATIGYDGQIGIMNAINKVGIFLENNEAMVSGGNIFYANRTHIFILEFMALLNSYTIETLDSFMNSIRSNCSLIVNVADKDKAYSYEAPPFSTKRRVPDQPGLLVATNHFTDASWGILEPLHDTPDFSIRRRKNLLALAERYKGEFSPKKMMEILDISISNGGVTIPQGTIYQIVVVPEELKVWLKIPGFQNWTKVDLKPLFKN